MAGEAACLSLRLLQDGCSLQNGCLEDGSADAELGKSSEYKSDSCFS